jgi:hypothetical protein
LHFLHQLVLLKSVPQAKSGIAMDIVRQWIGSLMIFVMSKFVSIRKALDTMLILVVSRICAISSRATGAGVIAQLASLQIVPAIVFLLRTSQMVSAI